MNHVPRWASRPEFFSSLLILIALGGLYAEKLIERYSDDRKDIANKYYDDISSNMDSCRSDPNLLAMVECIVDAVDSANEDRTSYKDLRAQQDMSIWAFGILILSGLTFLVSVLGIYFVYETLRATNKTLGVMQKEQRPWLSVSDPILSRVEAEHLPLGSEKCRVFITVSVSIENSGKEPAQRVFVNFHAASAISGHDTIDTTPPNENVLSIAPGESMKIERRVLLTLNDKKVRDVIESTVKLAVGVGYDASNNEIRKRTACYFILMERPQILGSETSAIIVPHLFKNRKGERTAHPSGRLYFRRMSGSMT